VALLVSAIRNRNSRALKCPVPRLRQSGSALIVGLVFLLVITLIAVSGARNTILQERMSANLYDRSLAFQSAEAALREGLADAANRHGTPPASGFRPRDADYWLTHLTGANPDGHAVDADLHGVSESARYFVEEIRTPACPPGQICDAELGASNWRTLYRVTAIGFGGTQEAMVLLQVTGEPEATGGSGGNGGSEDADESEGPGESEP